MKSDRVPFRTLQHFSRVTVERAQEKAQKKADRSSNPDRFMEFYRAALYQLRWGVDLEDRFFARQSPLETAAEAEALAAFRMLLSYTHIPSCSCAECRQRRMEQAQRSKE